MLYEIRPNGKVVHMDALQTLKGFRDFLPAEARKRQYVIEKLKTVFELYGFAPLETPALEYEELLTGKYGEEADKLMYRFTDNGERRVAMRYDQTVPLARVVAQYPEIPKPFKRYQIQPVWRADNTQKGRFREFLQCDIDIVGSDSILADAEVIAAVVDGYKALGISSIKVLINDRNVLFDVMKQAGIPEDQYTRAILTIDKLDKKTPEAVQTELIEKGFSQEIVSALFDGLKSAQMSDRLMALFSMVAGFGIDPVVLEFRPYLARGLDYYTSTIFECVIPEYTVGSVGGGGRYDKLIEKLSGVSAPAVGYAFGFDRTVDAMTDLSLFPDEMVKTRVLVTIFDDTKPAIDYAIAVASTLRKAGISTDLFSNPGVKLEKQLKYADKQNMQYAIIAGEKEIASQEVTIKTLATHEQQTVSLNELVQAVL